jgi:hypothetical protein
MTLLGAEEVSRAANRISQAAEEMKIAAGWNLDAVNNLTSFLNGWLVEFKNIMEQNRIESPEERDFND